ncbi:MAG: T9SS type A sorting domain-containing protein [Chitinophagaceae bacterium]|nr:T9SS type A sorting domain-containing protein [Chitinophagaceae bacterium]
MYSKILRVEMGSTKVGFSLYPNPVVGKQLTVSLSGLRQGQYNLEVFSATGQRVYATRINNAGSGVTQMIELPASVKSGAYVTVISGDTYRESKQFIVK